MAANAPRRGRWSPRSAIVADLGGAADRPSEPDQQSLAPTPYAGSALATIPIEAIGTSQRNPRQRVKRLEELAASLASHGLLQPVVVRDAGGQYELIAGHRRLEAARQLGWQTIQALVRTASEDEAYLLTLIENLQRENLSPHEEADALAILVRQRGWSTRQVAEAVQRSAAFVSKRLRVFEDPMLAPAVLANQLSISAAEVLLSVPEHERNDLLARAIEGGWELPQIRAAIRQRFDSKQSGTPRRFGLSRRVRDLRHELRDLTLADLTEADRRELRQLYMDMGLLGRAKLGTASQRIFPPLPVISARPRADARGRRSQAGPSR